MSGVADVRAVIAGAQDELALNGARTVLFLDEIHRFNKAQQDALLPHVEDGTITLIGATTENPYFEVNAALLSRLRVWRLEPLTNEQVGTSSGGRSLTIRSGDSPGSSGRTAGSHLADEAFDHLVDLAGGDARHGAQRARGRRRPGRGRGHARRRGPGRAAPSTTSSGRPAADPRLRPGRRRPLRHGVGVHQEPARQRPRRRAVLAGHDGRGRRGPPVHRPAADHQRASEDVGNADPRALRWPSPRPRRSTGWACPRRSTRSPRRRPTSRPRPSATRSGAAYWAAVADVDAPGLAARAEPPAERRPPADASTTAIGVGYRYPHDFEGADVDQQYLPDELAERRYYVPNDQGYEATIGGPDGRARGGEGSREAAAQEPAEPADGRDVGRASPGRVEPAQDRRDPARGRRRLKAGGPTRDQ